MLIRKDEVGLCAQEHLLCNHEDLSSDASTHVIRQAWSHFSLNSPVLVGGGDRRVAGA